MREICVIKIFNRNLNAMQNYNGNWIYENIYFAILKNLEFMFMMCL